MLKDGARNRSLCPNLVIMDARNTKDPFTSLSRREEGGESSVCTSRFASVSCTRNQANGGSMRARKFLVGHQCTLKAGRAAKAMRSQRDGAVDRPRPQWQEVQTQTRCSPDAGAARPMSDRESMATPESVEVSIDRGRVRLPPGGVPSKGKRGLPPAGRWRDAAMETEGGDGKQERRPHERLRQPGSGKRGH